MPRPLFSYSWVTPHHTESPQDLLWHLFWGILVGGTMIYAIISGEFLVLTISILALIFFFHPFFHEPHPMQISLNEQGVRINHNFYPWEKFSGFEFFDNGERTFLFLMPRSNFATGLHFPVASGDIDLEDLRLTLNQFLDEYEDAVPVLDKVFRGFWR